MRFRCRATNGRSIATLQKHIDTSLVTTTSGAVVGGSAARYLPLHCVQGRLFGGWRTTPTAVLTDIGHILHQHNNIGTGTENIGLVYRNGRYLLPSPTHSPSRSRMVRQQWRIYPLSL